MELNIWSERKIYDVVIIGAGLSGLTAAFRLQQMKADISMIILEAKDRIGGRLFSVDLPAADDGTGRWDLGGTWIGNRSIQPFINQLLADLEIGTYKQNFHGYKIMQTSHDDSTVHYDTSIPDISLLSLFDTRSLVKSMDKEQKKLSSVDGYLSSYDSMTAETLLEKKAWTKVSKRNSRAAMRCLFGVEMNQISALFLLQFAHSCGGFYNFFESGEQSSQAYKIQGGAASICSKIMDRIGYGTLVKNSIVTSITQEIDRDDNKCLNIKTVEDKSYLAHHVIVAIPPHLVRYVVFDPPLSSTKVEYFTAVKPGHSIKIILTYERAFWTEKGASGEVITNGGTSHVKNCTKGPICVVFDATSENMKPALVVFICAQQAIEYESRTKEERKNAILKSLHTIFDCDVVYDFIVYYEKIWRHEPFVGGCPSCIVPPGVAKCINNDLRTSENGIHFASSELGRIWIGLMEGAVESGERAALEILSNA